MKALREINHNEIRTYLLGEGCDFEFKFNSPTASHMGEVWERQIRTVRNVLSALMTHNGSQLNDESLRTFMCEAAAVVNSRPLTVENLFDPQSPLPLAPNQILTMKSKIVGGGTIALFCIPMIVSVIFILNMEVSRAHTVTIYRRPSVSRRSRGIVAGWSAARLFVVTRVAERRLL